MQDRLDDYLQFGVPNIWEIDPAAGGIMLTADRRIAMPLVDVLLP